MVLLKYAIVAVTDDGYKWFDILFNNWHDNFRNVYLYDDLRVASVTCDILNELEDGASTCKVCSVNVIIDDK